MNLACPWEALVTVAFRGQSAVCHQAAVSLHRWPWRAPVPLGTDFPSPGSVHGDVTSCVSGGVGTGQRSQAGEGKGRGALYSCSGPSFQNSLGGTDETEKLHFDQLPSRGGRDCGKVLARNKGFAWKQ